MKLIFVMRNGAFKPQGSLCLKSGFFKYAQKKSIEEETERAPPLPALMRYELEDSYDWGDFPPDEAYFCDAQWGL